MSSKTEAGEYFDLSGQEVAVLRDVLEQAQDWPYTIDVAKFDIAHEDHLEVLETLVRRTLLEREDNRYSIPILGLASLSKYDKAAELSIFETAHIFSTLRELYKHQTGKQISIGKLGTEAKLPFEVVRRALELMKSLPLWSGRSVLLSSEEAYVVPGSGFLKYKTFAAVLEQIRSWRRAGSPRTAQRSFRRAKSFAVSATPVPTWERHLSKQMRGLLRETQAGIEAGARALPAMGMRAMLDLALNDLGGDTGGFKRKLDILVEQKKITEGKRKILDQLLEIGHASAHRAYFPSEKKLRDAFECVANIVYEVCVLEDKAFRLSRSIPKRLRK